MTNRKTLPKTFTLQAKVIKAFGRYCSENSINRSSLINSLVTKYLIEKNAESYLNDEQTIQNQ